MSDPSGAVTTDALSAAPDLGPAEAPASNPTPTDSQTPPASTDAPTPDALDLEALSKHPDFQKHVEELANKRADALAQKRMDRQARRTLAQQADQALADDDADTAMNTLREAKRYLVDPEDGASIPLSDKEQALRTKGLVDSEEYKALWFSPERDALDEAFKTLTPSEFEKWVQDKTTERKTAEDKRIATVAAALVEQEINKRLGAQPAQPMGSSVGISSDDQFLEEYSSGRSNDHARYQALQKRQFK